MDMANSPCRRVTGPDIEIAVGWSPDGNPQSTGRRIASLNSSAILAKRQKSLVDCTLPA